MTDEATQWNDLPRKLARVSKLRDNNGEMLLFQNFSIRRVWHEDAWWYSLVDCMVPLAGTKSPRGYWSDLKRKLKKEGAMYEDFVHSIPMPGADGRMAKTDCTNNEGLLRVIPGLFLVAAQVFGR